MLIKRAFFQVLAMFCFMWKTESRPLHTGTKQKEYDANDVLGPILLAQLQQDAA
jgi:hypothetical protein